MKGMTEYYAGKEQVSDSEGDQSILWFWMNV